MLMQGGRPATTCSPRARSWPATCSARGYAAGIGMTIGSVFGRIAGREAAHARTVSSHHGDAQRGTLAEADRLMTVCNACRYCEGLCAVFPGDGAAPHFRGRRPQLPRQSLPRLRRLLFDCQFAPPHEFDVNVPEGLAQIRKGESYAGYACGRIARAGLFARNGVCISHRRGVERRGVHHRVCGLPRSRGALRHPHRPGAFYR